ncbi:MAG: LPS assembly lipoprotein LptE [Candidatus Nitrotoga sp.]
MLLPERTIFFSTILLTLLLSACGFHLRGQISYALPFQSITVRAFNDFSPIVAELKQALQDQGVQIVDAPIPPQPDPMPTEQTASAPANANPTQLILHVASETTSKQILSLSRAGRVREFQLNYRVMLRVYDQQQQDWIFPATIDLQRNLPYDDTLVLAKESEEAQLYQEMRHDAVQQIMRQLNAARKPDITPPIPPSRPPARE